MLHLYFIPITAVYAVVLCAFSFCMALGLLLLREQFSYFSGRTSDLNAVQSAHTRKTPRIGGVAIFGALFLSTTFAPVEITDPYFDFVFCTAILFSVGLLEDLGFSVPPRRRLLAAVVASLMVIFSLGVWIPRVGIPELDFLVDFWFLGIPLTVLLTSGIANGFNLIDGVNGLASVTAIIAAIALGLISAQAGYPIMVQLTVMLAASVTGFLLLNFPFGLIFLGDAGAYTLGFVLSWFGIAVLINAPEVSPWAILLTMFWPVADTLLAIFRRSRRGLSSTMPDRLHVHQMVMRALEICFLSRSRRSISNPLTTLLLLPFLSAPPLAGVLLWDQNSMAFLAVSIFAGMFCVSYLAAPRYIARFRLRTTCPSEKLDFSAVAQNFDGIIPDRSKDT